MSTANPDLPKPEDTIPSPESGPVLDVPVDESHLAISALASFIYTKLLDRVEAKIEEKENTDRFIKHVGDSARVSRGFGANPVLELPDSPSERVASSFRHFQVRRIRKIEGLIHGIKKVYGTKDDPGTVVPPLVAPRPSEMSAERKLFRPERIDRLTEVTKKRVVKDADEKLDFSSKPHETKKIRKSTAKAKVRYEKLVLKKRKLHASLDRGVSGDTFFGRRRTRKLTKLRNKQQRYKDRLGRP